MYNIVYVARTQKKEPAQIRVRLRLLDTGRVDIMHSTNIKASMEDLDKFTRDCKLKPKVKVYNRELLDDLKTEIKYMERAYEEMKALGLDLTSEVMENLITGYRTPIKVVRKQDPTIMQEFRRYIEASHRDGIIGENRMKHIIVVADKLERYLSIKGQSKMTPKEFTEATLLDFRQFIYDEYLYVPKHKRLYKDMTAKNLPTERLSTNTVVSQLKMLHTFFEDLDFSNKIDRNPFRKLNRDRKRAVMKTKYDEPVFLRASEFQQILSAEIPKVYEGVRDAFVVHCAFGCRISDFQALTMDNISVSEDGIPYVHYLPQKTAGEQSSNAEVQTPVARFAFDIIKRTGFDFPIVRNIYGQNGYNVQLKGLLKDCGITRKVPIFNEAENANQYIPISDLASSKLARKTHIDMLNKVQINLYVAGLHKEGSSAVKRYTSMELADRFALINHAFSQEPYQVNEKLEVIEPKAKPQKTSKTPSKTRTKAVDKKS